MSETLQISQEQATDGHISLTFAELRALGVDVNEIPQSMVDEEFSSIVEFIDVDNVGAESIDPDIVAEEGQTAWPESNPDGSISEQDYSQRLSWRAGNVGHALDAVRHLIVNEADAATWLELKRVVAEIKAMGDVYAKVDAVIALEEVNYNFMQSLALDAEAYSTYEATQNP